MQDDDHSNFNSESRTMFLRKKRCATEEFLVLVGKDIEPDAVDRQFEPYPYRRMRLYAGGAHVVWPRMLFPNSRGIKAAGGTPALLPAFTRVDHCIAG